MVTMYSFGVGESVDVANEQFTKELWVVPRLSGDLSGPTLLGVRGRSNGGKR